MEPKSRTPTNLRLDIRRRCARLDRRWTARRLQDSWPTGVHEALSTWWRYGPVIHDSHQATRLCRCSELTRTKPSPWWGPDYQHRHLDWPWSSSAQHSLVCSRSDILWTFMSITRQAMFCRTRCQSNPLTIDRTIKFMIVWCRTPQNLITMETNASLWHILTTPEFARLRKSTAWCKIIDCSS